MRVGQGERPLGMKAKLVAHACRLGLTVFRLSLQGDTQASVSACLHKDSLAPEEQDHLRGVTISLSQR